MTVHSFYLFNRQGTCLCYREWSRPSRVLNAANDQKNMFGLLFALRQFSTKLSPKSINDSLRTFTAKSYALHYYETPSGLRFVLTTSRDYGRDDLVGHLKEIYTDIYVEFVVRNPFHVVGRPIDSPLFLAKLDDYIKLLPCF